RLQLHVTAFVLAVVEIGIKADRNSAAFTVIQTQSSFDIVSDRERNLGKERRAPRTQIGRRNRKAEGIIERLVHVRPPKDWDVADVESYILKNDMVIFVNANRSGTEVKIGPR